MTIYEAFVPSGTESADISSGFFTGDPEAIREWVADNSNYWKTHQVRLVKCHVRDITMAHVLALRDAKAVAEQSLAALNALRASLTP